MCKILVVESDYKISAGICNILNEAGYTAHLAASVKEALERLEIGDYTLVIASTELPDGTGFDLIDAIDDAEIIIVGHVTEALKTRAARLGVSKFINRPFDEVILLTAVDDLVLDKQAPRMTKTEREIGDRVTLSHIYSKIIVLASRFTYLRETQEALKVMQQDILEKLLELNEQALIRNSRISTLEKDIEEIEAGSGLDKETMIKLEEFRKRAQINWDRIASIVIQIIIAVLLARLLANGG